MRLRMLNEHGLQMAGTILSDLRTGSIGSPEAFTADPGLTIDLGIDFSGPRKGELSSRFELAIWLDRMIGRAGLDRKTVLDPRLWTWLTFALFEVVCPVIDGTRQWQKDDARYLYRRRDFRKSFRHLLVGPYFLYQANNNSPHSLRAILANPPHRPGELFEQMASRQAIFASSAALEVASRLYWDDTKKALRRGAGGSGAGSPRRLAEVFMQLEVTHDLVACTGDYLIELLPREFKKQKER
jgi:hypothetical protein